MSFKGVIPAGNRVTVSLEVDPAASGPASAFAAFARWDDGRTQSDGIVVAPGSNDVMSLDVDVEGMVRVFVDMRREVDTGTLNVKAVDAMIDGERIVGDTVWTYHVAPRDDDGGSE